MKRTYLETTKSSFINDLLNQDELDVLKNKKSRRLIFSISTIIFLVSFLIFSFTFFVNFHFSETKSYENIGLLLLFLLFLSVILPAFLIYKKLMKNIFLSLLSLFSISAIFGYIISAIIFSIVTKTPLIPLLLIQIKIPF